MTCYESKNRIFFVLIVSAEARNHEDAEMSPQTAQISVSGTCLRFW
jgi:hypothetical protein